MGRRQGFSPSSTCVKNSLLSFEGREGVSKGGTSLFMSSRTVPQFFGKLCKRCIIYLKKLVKDSAKVKKSNPGT